MSRKRLIRLVIAALVFAVVGRVLAVALGSIGPWVLIPLVAVAFWWLNRQSSDVPDDASTDAPERVDKAKSAPTPARQPSGKRVTAPKPKSRRR